MTPQTTLVAALLIAASLAVVGIWLMRMVLTEPEPTEPDPALFDQARLELVSDPLSFAEHTAAALRLVEHRAEVIDFPEQRGPSRWS